MTMFRTKISRDPCHLLLAARAGEIIDNFVDPLFQDTEFVDDGTDMISKTNLRNVLTQSLIACHVPPLAQPDFLEGLKKHYHIKQCVGVLKQVADKYHLHKMTNISYLGDNGQVLNPNQGQTVSTVTDGAGRHNNTGASAMTDTSTPTPNDKGASRGKGTDSSAHWIAPDFSARMPNGRCLKCTALGHKAIACSSTAWCPGHKVKGHTWDQCRERQNKTGKPAGGT